MVETSPIVDYGFHDKAVSHTHAYLYPAVKASLDAEAIDDLLVSGGIAILSMPYHSYLKNLMMAACGKMESHFTALWEGWHIKFWSRATLGTLFARRGFDENRFDRVGRIPALTNSIVVTCRKKGG